MRIGDRDGGATGETGAQPEWRSGFIDLGRNTTVSFELKPHTADVGVEATGETPGALFASIADGLAAAMCEEIPETGGDRFDIELEAESLEGLLYDYLDQLIYERDANDVLPVDNHAIVSGTRTDDSIDDEGFSDDEVFSIDANYRAVPLSEVVAREIKAVTYSEMTVERRDGGWYGYVVFDV